MGRFYLRVFKDGIRERTWGCGSRSENNQHYIDYISNLLYKADKCYHSDKEYSQFNFGTRYRIELIKNRHGEKELYREVEIELDILNTPIDCVSYTVCKDVTYITDGFDPRVLALPTDW